MRSVTSGHCGTNFKVTGSSRVTVSCGCNNGERSLETLDMAHIMDIYFWLIFLENYQYLALKIYHCINKTFQQSNIRMFIQLRNGVIAEIITTFLNSKVLCSLKNSKID